MILMLALIVIDHPHHPPPLFLLLVMFMPICSWPPLSLTLLPVFLLLLLISGLYLGYLKLEWQYNA